MQQNQEALNRAVSSASTSNYGAIFHGFAAMGIGDVRPRENVFTLQAWNALGRRVKKGEHGVSVSTWIPMTKRNEDTGEQENIGRKPRTSTVFHVSQTEARDGYSDGLWLYALANGVLPEVPAMKKDCLGTQHQRATPTHNAAAYYSDEFTPIA